jgi:hypothetical protein
MMQAITVKGNSPRRSDYKRPINTYLRHPERSEGPRCETLKVTSRDPLTIARDDVAKLPLSLRRGIPKLRSE